MNEDYYYHKKHPKFLVALFGAFFKVFGLLRFKKLIDKLLRTTRDDERVPTDRRLDEAIENLAFYMEYIWRAPIHCFLFAKCFIL